MREAEPLFAGSRQPEPGELKESVLTELFRILGERLDSFQPGEQFYTDLAEELKDALRRQSVDRELAKTCIRFLGQPMGRSLHIKLKKAHDSWSESRDDTSLLAAIGVLANQFSKERTASESVSGTKREDLELICFEYVTG